MPIFQLNFNYWKKSFTGFGECKPHVDYVHNDIFLAWEDDKEGIIRELSIEEAIDEMCKNGCITPDRFTI